MIINVFSHHVRVWEGDAPHFVPDLRNGLFLSFPHVCPEPVLVKRSLMYKNGQKAPFFLPRKTAEHHRRTAGRGAAQTRRPGCTRCRSLPPLDRCSSRRAAVTRGPAASESPYSAGRRRRASCWTTCCLQKIPLLNEFPLCLSRACLRKRIVVSM